MKENRKPRKKQGTNQTLKMSSTGSEELHHREFLIAKEMAEESELKFRTLFEELQDGITLTHRGILVDINRYMLKMLGVKSKKEVIGKNTLDFLTPASKRKAEAEIRKFQSKQTRKFVTEFSYYHSDGREITAEIRGVKVELGGKIYGLSVHHDITHRLLIEQQLIQAKENAEESNNLKTAFLQNMSHEIRTPMNAIVGFSGMLNKPDLTDEKRREFTDLINKNSKQLLAIVTDILTVSSLDTKQERLHISEININNILSDLYAVFQPQAAGKGLSIILLRPLSDELAEINTDGTKLLEVMSNLLSNAIKFTGKGSITFGYVQKKQELEFYVKDTGIGISVENCKKIFDRFVQAEPSITKKYGGTGLGLSISKGFVELLGGKIRVKSKPEHGSTFYFTIPYKQIGV
jgi:PAS domain S-box-containing protein